MHNLIDFVGGNTRFDGSGSDVKDLTCQATHSSHTLHFCLVQDLDLAHTVANGPLAAGDTILGVVGARYALGNLASGGQRVVRAKSSGVWKVRERIVSSGFWMNCNRRW